MNSETEEHLGSTDEPAVYLRQPIQIEDLNIIPILANKSSGNGNGHGTARQGLLSSKHRGDGCLILAAAASQGPTNSYSISF